LQVLDQTNTCNVYLNNDEIGLWVYQYTSALIIPRFYSIVSVVLQVHTFLDAYFCRDSSSEES